MILLIPLFVFAISVTCRGTNIRNADVLNFAVASSIEVAKEPVDLNAQTGAYDLIMLDDPWFPRFANAELLADLTPLYQKRNRSGLDDNFIPASLALCRHP